MPELTKLSPRELEVIECASRDMGIPQTATELFVSKETIRTHRKHILAKMGTYTMAGAVGAWLRGSQTPA
jgi:LuxR family maltose regulon positive regulatory protein